MVFKLLIIATSLYQHRILQSVWNLFVLQECNKIPYKAKFPNMASCLFLSGPKYNLLPNSDKLLSADLLTIRLEMVMDCLKLPTPNANSIVTAELPLS